METTASEKKSLGQKMKDHKIITILIIIALVIVGYRLYTFVDRLVNEETAAAELVSVKVAEASLDTISSEAPLSGRISPVEEAAIVPLAQGRVTAVHVKVGDYVEAGTVLFEIDKGQIATSYAQAKAAYDLAASTYSKMKVLYEEGAISKSDFDSAELQYITSKETLASASDAIGNYNVATPISGYVTSLSVDVGSIAGQGMAASVADTSELKIEAAVSEYLAGKVHIGDVVDVYVTALGDVPYSGTVTEFSPAPALGTYTYPITVSLDNESGDLMSGMFAEIRFTAEESRDVVCVPSNAVIVKNGKNVVVTIDSNCIPSYAEVETGIDTGEKVEITSGLSGGETIIVSGQDFITEGEQVNVIE